ncbi:MAG: single-stranded-DNA-specific exonuclease RecJ [Rudaea sp.]|nr:single-stranded-DNA-specific exonuclease RecJ [Rudaea sp.]
MVLGRRHDARFGALRICPGVQRRRDRCGAGGFGESREIRIARRRARAFFCLFCVGKYAREHEGSDRSRALPRFRAVGIRLVRADRCGVEAAQDRSSRSALREWRACRFQAGAPLAFLAPRETAGVIGRPRIQRRPVPLADADRLAGLHPVLRRVYASRGVTASADIAHRLIGLLAPAQLGGVVRACELIENALREDAAIVIVGDFDADGATGTAIAVRGLRMFGANRVDYGVPNRFTHGYGLSPALVEELAARHPRLAAGGLLITVDNGVSAHAGVAAATALGMRVVVTDHHLPGETLPAADAIVNPNLDGDAFPSKALCGAGVMFYLLLALRAHLRDGGWFASVEKRGQGSLPADSRDPNERKKMAEPDLSSLLDLVALGTVADLVPLDHNNRILVDAGLKRIRAGRACAGVAALLESGKRDPARAVASDLGYVVGPRINAAGRLEDIRLGIECLLTDDRARAQRLAEQLSAINNERRDLQAGMVEQAERAVEDWLRRHGAQALPTGIVLFEPGWHHGVVGLVASKLKERFHRPVVACAAAGDGSDEAKGSCRSIAGFHLRDALAEVDARAPGLLQRYGGHAMAAGLSLRCDDVARFAEVFDAVARERIAPEQLDAVLLTDGALDAADFTLELAEQLRYAGPWGQAFPEPLFDGEFTVVDFRVVGETHLRLRLSADGFVAPIEAMLFGGYDGTPPPSHLRAAYSLDVNEWNGTRRLQLLLRHIEKID